jgi:hypothetical protein
MAQRQNGGAPLGNQNALGAKRKATAKERAARIKADKLLNLAVPEAVAVLISIMKDPASTNYDRLGAAAQILDRKIPKKTAAEVALEGMPQVVVKIPGVNWPAMSADPPLVVRPRAAVAAALEEAERA